jgi:hypothetical protein
VNEVLVSIAIVSRIAESSLVDLPELFISLIFENYEQHVLAERFCRGEYSRAVIISRVGVFVIEEVGRHRDGLSLSC